MSAPAHRRLAAVRDAGLWAGAAAVVTGLHVAAALWILRQPAEAAMDGGPPPSIMIDMAPMPTVAETGETQISPDAVDSMANEAPPVEQPEQETPPDPDAPPPEPEPEEPPPDQEREVEPEPDQEVPPEVEPAVEPEEQEVPPEPDPEPQPEEVVEEIVESLPEAEVALPRSPRPPPRPQPAKKPEPQKPRAAPSEAAAKARTEAPRAERTAAAQDSANARAGVSPAQWKSKVMSHLLRRKPRAPGDVGTAMLVFSIDGGGNVLSARIAQSSGSARIDKAVLDMIRRASPVPAPPPGVDRTITVPVEFKR